MLLAIDPGTDTGWAIFDSCRRLVACGLGDPRLSDKHRIADINEVIVESPMIYRGTKNPNDILKLAVKAGEWGGVYAQCGVVVGYVKPFEWKGSVPKDVHHARLWAKLAPEEQAIVDRSFKTSGAKGLAQSKRHNVLDAIGLGLFKVSR